MASLYERARRRAASLLLLPPLLAACGPSAKLTMVDKATRLKHPDVPTVGVDEAKGLVEAGALWVDVRTDAERSVSRIPGAIDGETILEDPSAYADKILLAYCTIGVRSADWAAARRTEGLDVRNVEGSVMAWARAGESFVAPDGTPTTRVHTWSDRFDWLPEGYEGVSEPPVPK
jgi:sodium/bile acid cotransporter 7